MADIKIVEHVVQELPSERPLVTGHKYKVQQENGDLLEYLVDSNGEPKFVRGVTDDQNTRLERMSSEQISKVESITTGDIDKLQNLDSQQEIDGKINNKVDKESGKSLVSNSEIDKLENLKTQSEIDSDIATATSNASSQLIVVTGTVLPRGNDIPEYITTKGKAELLGGNDTGGKTFTNTGKPAPDDTFNVPKGSVGYAYYDKTSDSWSLVDMGELPTTPVDGVVEEGNTQAVSGGEVYDYIDNNIKIELSQTIDPIRTTKATSEKAVADYVKSRELFTEDLTIIADNATIVAATGVFGKVGVSSRTDFIKVNEGDKFLYSGQNVNTSASVAGYSSNTEASFVNTLLLGTNVNQINVEVTIPAGVNYIVAASRNETFSPLPTPFILLRKIPKEIFAKRVYDNERDITKNTADITRIEENKNYFDVDFSTVVANETIVLADGSFAATSVSSRTDFIDVKNGDVLFFSGQTSNANISVAGYSEKNTSSFVKSILTGNNQNQENIELTVTEGINYVVASSRNQKVGNSPVPPTLKLIKKTNVLDLFDKNPNEDTSLSGRVEVLESNYEAGKNLIDKSLITRGYYDSAGVFLQSENTISTPPIKINPEEGFLSLNKSPTIGIPYRFIFFDGDLSFISYVGPGEPREGVIIPPTAQFVALNIYSVSGGFPDPTDNAIVNDLQLEYGITSTEYESYGKKIRKELLPDTLSSKPNIKIRVISSVLFFVDSLHPNGDYVNHEWKKMEKATQHDIGWYASSILHKGRFLVQGSFNCIHRTAFPNENKHVGHAHGCETDFRTDFYLDGVKFNIDDEIGNTLEGNEFSFSIASTYYAVDEALTNSDYDGDNAVPQLPLIESTKNYRNGKIEKGSKTTFHNKLVILRENTSFNALYIGMHCAFRTFFDRMIIHNNEDTEVDLSDYTPIPPSTGNPNGIGFDTSVGRGELAHSVTSYSDRFGYIFRTTVIGAKEEFRNKMFVQGTGATTKVYFHPVITNSIRIKRPSLAVDVFNIGDVIEATIYRELTF